jgi:outer membrane protein assembly factor BamE (lipoprotein component of BamABCDE complex)
MIPQESLSFLEIEKTTKDEVREMLGEPWESDEADNEWLYKLRIVSTRRWGFCVPYSNVDCDSKDGKAVLYVIRIDFDDAGVVTGWEEFKIG